MAMLRLAIATRVGHAYAEHAVHADYVQMREYAWRGVPGSVINSECPKYHFCSSHLVLSILRNEKKRVQNQNILVKKLIFFTIDSVHAH